jgi:hypothetical protein
VQRDHKCPDNPKGPVSRPVEGEQGLRGGFVVFAVDADFGDVGPAEEDLDRVRHAVGEARERGGEGRQHFIVLAPPLLQAGRPAVI